MSTYQDSRKHWPDSERNRQIKLLVYYTQANTTFTPHIPTNYRIGPSFDSAYVALDIADKLLINYTILDSL